MDFRFLLEHDIYYDLERYRRNNELSIKDSNKLVKQLKKGKTENDEYRVLLLSLLDGELDEHVISKKRKREKRGPVKHNDYSDAEDDPQYMLFLHNLEPHKTAYVYKGERNGSSFSIVYEEDSDTDCYDSKDDDSNGVLPTQTSTHIEEKVDRGTKSSEFRKEIVRVLQKPYGREEFKALRRAIKVRKPVERHLDLRHGRERAYAKDEDGKSYLDHYPDLKKALSRCLDDKPRCLNLLRGFFFWLQHLTMEGEFKPWKDAECLAVEPKCRDAPSSSKGSERDEVLQVV